MNEAKKGNKVSIAYKCELKNGALIDSATSANPFTFTLGGEKVFKTIEDALIGMKKGEKKFIKLEPREAFGEFKNEMVLQIDKVKFPEEIVPEVGLNLVLNMEDKSEINVRVVEVGKEIVTVDGNHPLAGKELLFDIELLEVA